MLVLPVCFYLYSLSRITIVETTSSFLWLLTAFIGGQLLLLEITRKLRPRELENEGHDTYSARYGIVTCCVVTGILISAVIFWGTFAAAAAGGRATNLGYLGLALLPPVGCSLVTFAVRPTAQTAGAVFKWSAIVVLVTSILFAFAVWFV